MHETVANSGASSEVLPGLRSFDHQGHPESGAVRFDAESAQGAPAGSRTVGSAPECFQNLQHMRNLLRAALWKPVGKATRQAGGLRISSCATHEAEA
jgi:hypothetical protein